MTDDADVTNADSVGEQDASDRGDATETDQHSTDATETDQHSTDATETDQHSTDATVLDDLFATIETRKAELPDDSYTASLFTHEKGIDGVLEKLGEESTELTLAAKDGDNAAVRHESADLVYHLLVLLAMRDMTLDDLREELRDRFE